MTALTDSPLTIVPSVSPVERTTPTDLIDETALAERLGVSRSTLQGWRYAGRGPRYLKIGRLIRYRNADVDRFVDGSARGASV